MIWGQTRKGAVGRAATLSERNVALAFHVGLDVASFPLVEGVKVGNSCVCVQVMETVTSYIRSKELALDSFERQTCLHLSHPPQCLLVSVGGSKVA